MDTRCPFFGQWKRRKTCLSSSSKRTFCPSFILAAGCKGVRGSGEAVASKIIPLSASGEAVVSDFHGLSGGGEAVESKSKGLSRRGQGTESKINGLPRRGQGSDFARNKVPGAGKGSFFARNKPAEDSGRPVFGHDKGGGAGEAVASGGTEAWHEGAPPDTVHGRGKSARGQAQSRTLARDRPPIAREASWSAPVLWRSLRRTHRRG